MNSDTSKLRVVDCFLVLQRFVRLLKHQNQLSSLKMVCLVSLPFIIISNLVVFTMSYICIAIIAGLINTEVMVVAFPSCDHKILSASIIYLF